MRNLLSGFMKPVIAATAMAGSLLFAGAASAQDSGSAMPSSLQETYGDWTVACRTVEVDGEDDRLCELRQQLFQDDRRILYVGLAIDDEDGPTLTLIAPFGLDLQSNVVLLVDDEPMLDVPFDTCLAIGCRIRATMSDADIMKIGDNDNATVEMVTFEDKEPFPLELSLEGFSSAWSRLSALDKQQP